MVRATLDKARLSLESLLFLYRILPLPKHSIDAAARPALFPSVRNPHGRRPKRYLQGLTPELRVQLDNMAGILESLASTGRPRDLPTTAAPGPSDAGEEVGGDAGPENGQGMYFKASQVLPYPTLPCPALSLYRVCRAVTRRESRRPLGRTLRRSRARCEPRRPRGPVATHPLNALPRNRGWGTRPRGQWQPPQAEAMARRAPRTRRRVPRRAPRTRRRVPRGAPRRRRRRKRRGPSQLVTSTCRNRSLEIKEMPEKGSRTRCCTAILQLN